MENIIWDNSLDKYFVPKEVIDSLTQNLKGEMYSVSWIFMHNFVEAVKNAKGPEQTKEIELLNDIKKGKVFNVHDAIRLLFKIVDGKLENGNK